ncbi:MAG: MFS transporter [Cyanobacteria bacterium P01_A01_bin.105]
MRVFTQFSPALRWNLIVLFVAGLCFWAGLAGLLPSLPLYIEQFGASGQQIGLVMASFGVGLIILRPTMARLTDTWGRKPALLIGLSAIAAAPLTYLFVQLVPEVTWTLTLGERSWQLQSPLLLMMVFRAGHGLSIAAFVTGYSALVADLAPPDQRGELIGYMSLVNPIGMALGPALGGFLQSSSGFGLVFLSMASIGGVGFLCASVAQEPTRDVLSLPKAATLGRAKFWSLLWLPAIRIPAVMLLLVGLAFGSLATFIPLYARESNLAVNVGLIYTASAMASFAIRLLVGRASDQYGRGRFISLGLVLYTLSMAVLWLADSAPMVLLAGAIQGAGGGMLIPMVAALMADRSTPDQRGLMFGLCLTGFDIGIALSGPIMGWIADLTSYRDIFAIAGIMTLLGLVIFITTSSKDLSHSVRFALAGGQDIYAVPSP